MSQNTQNQNIQKTNQILLVAAVLLLALSAFTYRSSVSRADRFERGQKFLPTLDVDSVAEIVLREGAEGETKEVVLRRNSGGDRFVVQSADGYRADNAEVNRLLRKFLDLKLEKEVGEATDELARSLGVPAGSATADSETADDSELPDGTVEVVLRGAGDQDIVRFLVGDEFSEEGTTGRYLRRVGSSLGSGAGSDEETDTIYLTQGRFDLEVDSDSYVDQEILDVDREEIVAIRGDGFAFVREPKSSESVQSEDSSSTDAGTDAGTDIEVELGELKLHSLAEGEKESAKARSVKGVLSPLRFTSHHLADAPEVRGLSFDHSLRIELADGSGYVLELARTGNGEEDDASKAYLRVRGFHQTEQVYVDLDASEDEVRETSEVAMRVEEINAFTEYHGSWIYEVSTTVADRVGVRASELVDGS